MKYKVAKILILECVSNLKTLKIFMGMCVFGAILSFGSIKLNDPFWMAIGSISGLVLVVVALMCYFRSKEFNKVLNYIINKNKLYLNDIDTIELTKDRLKVDLKIAYSLVFISLIFLSCCLVLIYFKFEHTSHITNEILYSTFFLFFLATGLLKYLDNKKITQLINANEEVMSC